MNDSYLLTDEQMRHFITHGYLVLQNDLPSDFHAMVQDKIETVMAKEGNPGNNILPRVPEIQQIFDSPMVVGALTSVLGADYIMHPHRHCHFSQPGRRVQRWHKDSYWGYRKTWNHHPWWAMIFYFTQDITEDMGPSAIMPGTQFYGKRAGDDSEEEIHVLGQSGTFALIHYDLWHKGTANVSNRNRTMLKFQFVRMQPPKTPLWNNRSDSWQNPSAGLPKNEHQIIWRHMWRWLRNESGPVGSVQQLDASELARRIDQLRDQSQAIRLQASDALGLMGEAAAEAIPALQTALADESEPVSVNAAYALANMGSAGMQALLTTLRESTDARVTDNAAYGLSAVGAPAFDGLAALLDHPSEYAREGVAFALGELRSEAQEAVPALVKLTQDPIDRVRRNAVEALGTIAEPIQKSVPALIEALEDADEQVRFTAILSLTRIGTNAEAAVPALGRALNDENRYVRANAIDALARIGTPDAGKLLVQTLRAARWCPSTTPESTF